MAKRTQAENAQMAVAYRMSQGISIDEIADLQEIQRLNKRAVSAWERNNSHDLGEKERKRLDTVAENAWKEAESICQKHDWQIDAPGLWWCIYRANESQDIALPVF